MNDEMCGQQSKPDVNALMKRFRDQDFTIIDDGFVSGHRRFVISKQGCTRFFDLDEVIWNDISNDTLFRQADIVMSIMTEKETPNNG